ncbi:MAG: dUTP diphosphatase [Robiginitomaculum sp.]|nr:MAG: dUTP diphosphatase [Robiginitomaculum sp.]
MTHTPSRPTLAVKKLDHFAGLELPSYGTALAAGADLRAAVPQDEPITLAPGARALIPTGLAIAIPEDFEAQIRPRSGLALKHGLTVLNSPGTIDADYRGEVKILLINHGDEAFEIKRGMRIAQMIVSPMVQVNWVESLELPDSDRGTGGYGSTGV